MTETTHSGTNGLSELRRTAALGRFQTLRPYLEKGAPFTQIAQEHKRGLRTVNCCAVNDRWLGLAGFATNPIEFSTNGGSDILRRPWWALSLGAGLCGHVEPNTVAENRPNSDADDTPHRPPL
jgi:hypothetical protein